MQKNWGRNGVWWNNARGRKKGAGFRGSAMGRSGVCLLGKANNTRNPETELSLAYSETIKSSNVV